MYTLARSVSSRRQLFSESAASWAASVMKVTFNTGGRLFPGCFAKRCTRCTCMGSIPSVVASWRTKMVSPRFRSMRVFDSSKGAPSTTTERLWSSASLFAVCRLSMCRHTSFAIPDGDGEGCVVCNGSRCDCSICLTTALAVVSANDGFCRLVVMSVSGSVVAPTTLDVRMSSLRSIDRMVKLMSSCRMGEGFATHG